MSNVDSGLEIRVDPAKCLAYGNCVSIAPELFDLPAGARTAIALKRAATADEVEALEEAVRNCPVRALSLRPSS